MAVLVTGGAGYVGSHVVLALRDAGRDVVVLDDLSTGHRELVPHDVPLLVGDAGDGEFVAGVLRRHGVDAVIHMAALSLVEESVREPARYWRRNVDGMADLLAACAAEGVQRFVFSSSAAVYGSPAVSPIPESAATDPINPYGATKLAGEALLRDAGQAHGLGWMALRYFNVAGADAAARTGEWVAHATHLVKVVCQHAVGRRSHVTVNGADYPTPDGTCVRDYVHPTDVASAHVLALDALAAGRPAAAYNIGYGRGYSVREVVDAANRLCGGRLDIRPAPRRAGDPPSLVAAPDRARQELGWTPRHDNLDGIIGTALAWERKLLEMA